VRPESWPAVDSHWLPHEVRKLIVQPHDLDALRFARYEFQIRAREATVLPPFLGTTLRGAFGNALKSISCSMPHGDCQRCLLVERCIYPRIFETTAGQSTGLLSQSKDAPRPFIFVPPLAVADAGFLPARDDLLRFRVRVERDQSIGFGLSLIGAAVDDLPYMIHAVSSMSQTGFGAERGRFVLEAVAMLDVNGNREVVYTPDQTFVQPHGQRETLGSLVRARLAELRGTALATAAQGEFAVATQGVSASVSAQLGESVITAANPRVGLTMSDSRNSFESEPLGDELKLRFLTPTRLRIKRRLVEHPTFSQLIGVLSLRLSMIAQTHGSGPLNYDYRTMLARARDVVTRDSNLRLLALERRSNRQRTKLEIDGFTGDASFVGAAIAELLPLVVAGEFLHVGSGTAFGLGRYVILS